MLCMCLAYVGVTFSCMALCTACRPPDACWAEPLLQICLHSIISAPSSRLQPVVVVKPMLVQTCSSLPATCCKASKRQSCNDLVRLSVLTTHADKLSKPGSTARHPFQLFSSRVLGNQRVRVANPRHEGEQDTVRQSTNSWDEPPPNEDGHDASQQAWTGLDWAKMQSLAVLTGASTLAAVVLLQLSGKTDIPKLAYNNIPGSVQDALPEQLGGKRHKAPWQLFDIGAVVQKTKVNNHMCFASKAATIFVACATWPFSVA